MKVLGGDIGGTKTILAFAEVDGNRVRLLEEQRFPSREFSSFSALAREFVPAPLAEPLPACFGVAGPVLEGRSRVTKLPWVLEERELERELGLPRVRLINDFAAITRGIEALDRDHLEPLTPGEPDPEGPIAVLGAGTGLGEAFLIRSGGKRTVIPSEGGHVDFAPRNDLEIDFLRYMLQKYRRVSYDRVVSGHGLAEIYRFFRDSGRETESEELAQAIAAEGDPAPVLTRFASERGDRLAVAAVELFAAIYGAEAGNLALKVLARGGVYLAGGITVHILDRLKGEGFRRAYSEKGRLSPVVAAIPAFAILDPKVGLLGAALAAAEG
jgi:glucokinase